MQIAENSGELAVQLSSGAIKSIEITAQGNLADLDIQPLEVAVLKGALSARLESVNYVNAPVIAKKRGIDIIPVRPISIHPEVSLKAINKGLEDGYIKRGQIREALSHIKRTRQHLYDYDFCLIDFAPANDELTREMLSASDYILVPTTLDNGSVNGIGGLMEIFGEVRKERNPELKILGIYPAVCNKQTSYDIQMTEGLKSSLGDIYLDCPIRYSTDVKWSTDFGVPLAFNRKSAPATEDYRRLVKELLKRMGGN
jgi:cellulose biosynthesis protein BcsQ